MDYEEKLRPGVRSAEDTRSPSHALNLVIPNFNNKTEDYARDWVPVSEGRPSRSGEYIVLLRSRGCRVMGYAKAGETFIPRSMNQAVTHWAPVPPAPK